MNSERELLLLLLFFDAAYILHASRQIPLNNIKTMGGEREESEGGETERQRQRDSDRQTDRHRQ